MRYLQVDFVEELSNPMVSPVFSQMRQDVPKSIRPIRKGEQVRMIQLGGYVEGDGVCDPSWLFMQALKGYFPLTGGSRALYLVMVPSMSEITTLSSQFHR